MQRSLYFLAAAAMLGIVGCADPVGPRDVLELTVMEERSACAAPFPTTCYVVLRRGNDSFEDFSDPIEDFVFIPGVRQTIRVERIRVVAPPADGTRYRYRLLEVISRLVLTPSPTPIPTPIG